MADDNLHSWALLPRVKELLFGLLDPPPVVHCGNSGRQFRIGTSCKVSWLGLVGSFRLAFREAFFQKSKTDTQRVSQKH